MSENREQAVSVEQFVSKIMKHYMVKADDVMAYGYGIGWLEEQDIIGRASLLKRRAAARIIHQFICLELKEADEADVSAAMKLKDLYECRSCAGHVMQIYTKGIMDGHMDNNGRFIFGMNDKVSVEECQKIIDRLFKTKKRKTRIQTSDATMAAASDTEIITTEKALQLLLIKADKNALLIDVRTSHDYEENHLDGAVNIPLAYILKNPYAVCEQKDVVILLYCREGYQSEIAARCLVEVGYENVYCFAMTETKL